MKARIIVDSTSDLSPELKKRLYIVPLNVNFGEERYIDGVTIDNKTFYEKLEKCDALPTTSLASPAAFMDEYEKVAKAGESAVVITVASKLSGTYQSAVLASNGYENIYVVDGGNVAIASGILIELAVRLADEGKSAEEIAKIVEEEKKKIELIALVDTLDNLKKSGRISKTIAMAGGVLNIKPILTLIDGVIKMVSAARGLKMGYKMLVKEAEKLGGIDFSKPVLFGYTGLSDTSVCNFKDYSKSVWNERIVNVSYLLVGSVIGTHTGPGAIAIAFFRK